MLGDLSGVSKIFLITGLSSYDDKPAERLKEKDRTISELRVTVEELRTMVTDLRCTIANLNETLDEFKRKFFGTSSEKMKKGQSEDLSAQDTEPEETTVVKEHTRARKKKSVRDDLYALLPIRDIKCDVPESECFCPDCDAPMEHLGYKTVREELRITPAKVERVRYLQETLVCPACREEDDTTIKAAKTPTALLLHSPASPDMVAMVMYQKSCLYLPFTDRKRTGSRKVSLFQGRQLHTGITTVCWNILPLYTRHFIGSYYCGK